MDLPDLDPDRLAGWWPEYERFGTTVPCHGIYAERIAGLTVSNSVLETAAPDNRPAIACHQVARARFHNVASSAGRPATIYIGSCCQSIRPQPPSVFLCTTAEDTVAPPAFSKGVAAAVRKAGGQTDITVFPKGDHLAFSSRESGPEVDWTPVFLARLRGRGLLG